ncbi:calcium-binding protein cml45-related [Anaeramoeba flamelloides]|uniref:Calcium-binding protein cml45-related n=1 Tax=Anaeramoeba flamelloides TaxID=1746091 RepID=A0ABQ8XXL8_9EUKA|nr:calcium-binding protein cml45-related [Anaeramoeba flamelloides]
MSKKLSKVQILEFENAFKLFDKDGNGQIDRKELQIVLKSLGQNPTENQLKQMIDTVDQDGDGQIDFKEFLNLMKSKVSEEDNEQTIREVFDIFDRDGDGFITAIELSHLMSSLGQKMTENEINWMISAIDTSGEGKVSFDDFKNVKTKKKQKECFCFQSRNKRKEINKKIKVKYPLINKSWETNSIL